MVMSVLYLIYCLKLYSLSFLRLWKAKPHINKIMYKLKGHFKLIPNNGSIFIPHHPADDRRCGNAEWVIDRPGPTLPPSHCSVLPVIGGANASRFLTINFCWHDKVSWRLSELRASLRGNQSRPALGQSTRVWERMDPQ